VAHCLDSRGVSVDPGGNFTRPNRAVMVNPEEGEPYTDTEQMSRSSDF
jgi:hypothetical protein